MEGDESPYIIRGFIMEENSGRGKEIQKKLDVSKLVSIIPSPTELRREEKKIIEKRIRIKYDESLAENHAKISKELAKLLSINENDLIEIVVAGKKRFVFRAEIVDDLEMNIVLCYPEELREKGVADNSIATVRKYRKEDKLS